MDKTKFIGNPIDRKDGIAKVTGRATYSAEYRVSNVAYGYILTSNTANGKILSIDSSAAEKLNGVLGIYTAKNLQPFKKVDNNWATNAVPESTLPLSDDRISYSNQPLGIVVAETYEQARYAASFVKINFEESPVKAELSPIDDFKGDAKEKKRGDFEKGLGQSSKKIEAVYKTANEVHCQMEPHSIIAEWNGENLSVFEANQWLAGVRSLYAQTFGIKEENIEVNSKFVGGTFGGKAFPWAFSFITAAAARELKRPVKTFLTRPQMFAGVGHRTETVQKIAVGADSGGKLTALEHDVLHHTSFLQNHSENASGVSEFFYDVPNLITRQKVEKLNVGSPTWLRAPGETPGMFALESAMDELAVSLKLDPLELRLRNYTENNPENNKPFSAKFLRECYTEGAKKFGWKNRQSEPRSMKRGDLLIGYGMASATFPGARGGASAKARIFPNGTAEVTCATVDLGTGSYTVFAQVAAEFLKIPVEKVTFKLGESSMPKAFVSGGSMTAATVGPAVLNACQNLSQNALKEIIKDQNSPLFNSAENEIEIDGLNFKNKNSGAIDSVSEFMKRQKLPEFSADGNAEPDMSDKFEYKSWGAHFCEVSVDEQIGRVKVSRWFSAINVGKILNLKTATSQVQGSVVMGIGTALSEEMLYDARNGRQAVCDLAAYHIATQADIPEISVEFFGEPDLNFNPLGCRGVGEIGITGVSAAIANAVFNATGKRVRELPITPDKLI